MPNTKMSDIITIYRNLLFDARKIIKNLQRYQNTYSTEANKVSREANELIDKIDSIIGMENKSSLKNNSNVSCIGWLLIIIILIIVVIYLYPSFLN